MAPFIQYLIICPLVFIAGFIDAIAGGGGLISLPAYMIAGLPSHNAIATNKLSSTMGTTIATLKYAIKGYVPWKLCPLAVIAAFLGSPLGANLALLISDRYFKIILLFLLPLTFVYVAKKKSFNKDVKPLEFRKTLLITVLVSFIIGIYDGFYGPGTGTFLILFLTGAARISLEKANGLTKVINLSTNVAALTVYLINGKTIVLLGLVAGLFNIAGNYLGATMFEKKNVKFVKPVISVVIIIFFIKILIEVIG